LQGTLGERELALWHTGADYHLAHALAIVLASIVGRDFAETRARLAAALFTIGVVLFSGSLYVLALAGTVGSSVVVLLTPLGGLSLLAGWVMLALAALKSVRQ